MNISKLMTFIFRNRTIFWDISKWNRRQKKWDKGSIIFLSNLYFRLIVFEPLKEMDNNNFFFLL